ncbi:ESCRT-II subunit protein snf8 [Gaertneriomyces sp. JEL0708]|nr:ESCRT-II subunit protein snf8 [Gaertneriomyces sp. JEL0708]
MARRRIGIHGLQQQQAANTEFRKVGEELAHQQLQQLKAQLETFKDSLQTFAQKYRKDIKRDPVFRMHFQRMCATVGIDPLASNKGFWSELLGVGDFYYNLGIQIAEICIATRERNGGLIDIEELKRRLENIRGPHAQDISEDDITRSIKSLQPLGSGFEVLTIGPRTVIQSIPRELNNDFNSILTLAQSAGYVTAKAVQAKLGWDEGRALRLLEDLLKEGICWIDAQAEPAEYWVVGFFAESS